MTFRDAAIAAVVLIGAAQPAAAQSAPARTASAGDRIVAAVDVSRLPIDLDRIQREFRQTSIREERDGLNLRYFVEVFATAPPIRLFTPQDNLVYGPVPYGAPTHSEMLQMMTPREFRASGMMLGSGFRIPRQKTQGK